MSRITLSALHVFPIKSLRGIAAEQWEIAARGFALDRELMLVDEAGCAVTQREQHALALLATELVGDRLVIRAPHGASHTVSLAGRSDARLSVTIWKDTLSAEPVDPAADDWFSRYLDQRVRLVRFHGHRQVDLQFAREGDAVGFADGFPFLLASESSLADLSARVGQPLAMTRFRPNLVVAGAAPYAEDGWRRLRVGAVEFEVVKPCARCAVTTIDPATGDAGLEPLRTLASYRNAGGKVLFAWNLVHRGTGMLRVGDPVEVLG